MSGHSRKIRNVGILLALAGVLGGCSGKDQPSPDPVSTSGPMAFGTDKNSLCLPAPTGKTDFSYAMDALTNTGQRELKVTGIELVDAENLHLVEADVVTMRDRPLLGGWPMWPPNSI